MEGFLSVDPLVDPLHATSHLQLRAFHSGEAEALITPVPVVGVAKPIATKQEWAHAS